MSHRARVINLVIAAVIAAAAVAVILTSSGAEGEPEREAVARPAAKAKAEATAAPTPTAEPVPLIRYEGGEVVASPQQIEVEQGERVRFDVVSDVAEEIHVHAYDIYRDLVPGERTRVAFDADITGVVEVELHGTGEPIAELRVTP